MAMMHLTDEQAADALTGDDPACTAHAAACSACRAKVDAMRDTLRAVTDVEVPEPPPLFWSGFAARVNDAIDTAPPQRAWWASPGFAWASMAAVVLIAAVLLFPRAAEEVAPRVATTVPGATAPAGDSAPIADVLDAEPWPDDDAWALVRNLAGDLDYDDAWEAGIAPRPGAIERAAVELADDERAELVRLIQDELKRTGAS